MFADRTDQTFPQVANRTVHAGALHQAGRAETSRALFAEAEARQAEHQPRYPLLYGIGGYAFCDVLLAAAEREAWRHTTGYGRAGSRSGASLASDRGVPPADEMMRAALLEDVAAAQRRAAENLRWVTEGRLPPLSVGFAKLAPGRSCLAGAVVGRESGRIAASELLVARRVLEDALDTIRQSNSSDDLPHALLPCAWLYAIAGQWGAARQRLDEAFGLTIGLTTRGGTQRNNWEGGMRLHLIDTLLPRARLFGARRGESGDTMPYPWEDRTPTADLDDAARLIDICGYHRRDEELADARAALGC